MFFVLKIKLLWFKVLEPKKKIPQNLSKNTVMLF